MKLKNKLKYAYVCVYMFIETWLQLETGKANVIWKVDQNSSANYVLGLI